MEINQENIKAIDKLLKFFDTSKFLSTQDTEEVLKVIIKLLATFKKDNEALNEETKNAVQPLLARIEEQQNNLEELIKQTVDSKSQEINSQVASTLEEIKSLVQEVKATKPKDGKDADEERVIAEILAKIKLPEYKEVVLDGGEEIVAKINDLPTDDDDLKIGVQHIKGLKKFVKENQQTIISGGITGRDLFKDIDLSDSLDGVTKTFNIQAVWNIISVSLSSYPYGALRKDVDFTWTPTSITFTSEIDAGTQLASGQKCILTVVLA